MKEFSLYRKRIIPDECILLKNDHIVSFENNRLVTTWSALHPKKDLHHGISCYFLEHGIKVSKFYYEDGRLLYWYIDIITHSWNEDKSSLTVIDLLADVLIYRSFCKSCGSGRACRRRGSGHHHKGSASEIPAHAGQAAWHDLFRGF